MKIYTFPLTNENINQYLSLIRQAGTKYKAEKRMLTEACITIEEVMLNYQSHFGAEQEIELKLKKRVGEFICTLSLSGECYDPVGKNETAESYFILNTLNLAPHYAYSLGVNQVTVSCKVNQGGKELHNVCTSVLLGIVIGVLGKFLPDIILNPAGAIVNALSDKIIGLMKMVAMPIVFLCVMYGVLGSGTVQNFKKNGMSILKKYLLSMLCMLLFVSAVSIFAFGIHIVTEDTDIFAVNNLVNTLFDMVPDNIFSPFVEGDNVKIILLGIVFGCALLTLGDKVGGISRSCAQLKEICSTIMSWIGKLIPVLIVVVLVGNIWSGNLGMEVLSAWKILAVYFASTVAMLLYNILRTMHICKMTFKEVIKAILVPGMKGLISASAMFCYSDMDDTLKNKLKVSPTTVDFGIPLGLAFYQPTTLLYAIFVLYYASASGVVVNPVWIVSFLLICFVTGIAVPPVSGGAVSLLAVIFVSFGISDAATAMAFPLMMLLDYPNTSFRVMTLIMKLKMEQVQRDKKGESLEVKS